MDQSQGMPLSGSAAPAHLELDAVYDAHFEFVWRSLLRLGVPPDAIDDAVQDVFLVVHRRLVEFEQRSALKTWLFGIALRVAREHARRRRRHGPPQEDGAEIEDEDAPDPLEQVVRSEARDLLYALIAELDEEKRTVFVLADIEGMSMREISDGLGVNANTLTSRLRAARKQFEAALARHRARGTTSGAANE
ncbi:MAG TPA: RNA polymerase sigma factor [Polyangiaceae bacterium]